MRAVTSAVGVVYRKMDDATRLHVPLCLGCLLASACMPAGPESTAQLGGAGLATELPAAAPSSATGRADALVAPAPRVLAATRQLDGGSVAAEPQPAQDDADGGIDGPAPGDLDTPLQGEWTQLGYLGCNCADGTGIEGCADYRSGRPVPTCAERCAAHGGMVGQGEGPPPSYYCRAPRLGGPDRVTCRCEDGHEATFCADLWCSSEDQRLHLCAPTCEAHGGLAVTECQEVDHDACSPSGPNLVRCACESGLELEICTSRDCMESIETHHACAQPCAEEGGGWVGECTEQAARCP